jgi:tight adherence protein B
VTFDLVLFFVATFGAVIGVTWLVTQVQQTSVVSGSATADEGLDAFDSELLRDESLSTISFWDGLLQRFDFVEIMKLRLSEGGMNWTVGRLTMMMLLAGSATWGVMRVIDGVPGWVTLAAAAGATSAPYLAVLRRRGRRLRRFEKQLPDALDTLGRALRAGHPIAAGLELLARETPMPLRGEMRKVADERALGMPLDQALENLAARVPVSEVSEFVAAVQMQSKAGGKLHEVLAQLAETMRDGEDLRSEIESIAAHGRLTGLILTLMPLAIAGAMTLTNPAQMAILWVHPLGRNLIAAAVICLVLAHVVIRKLVDIRV